MPPLSPQQRAQLGSQARVQPTSVPAPFTGWNTRDALDEMSPTDAILLDNWYPDTTGVTLRNGYVSHATGIGTGNVKTIVEYNAGAIRKMLSAASGGIYDSSAPAAATLIKNGFTQDAWQTVNFLSHLFFVNGADAPQIYDGTTMTNASFTGTSLTLSTLVGVESYQQRLFFWQTNSTGFWFAQLNSISGALSFFDLGSLCPRGGNLIAATTTTHDGGNGVFDFITFIMSSGDCIHFLGNDPSQAASWQLIGVYRIAPPVSPRAVCQYGAESFLTTADDHVPLQQQLVALKVGQLPPRSKISSAVQQAVNAGSNLFGWQALYYPAGRRLIFNVPNLDGTFSQHICNTTLPAQPWTRFTGMNSFCWGLYNNNLYFGGAGGIVYQADFGSLDNGVNVISGNAQQAWNMFGVPLRKRITACRPILQAAGNANFVLTLGFDYGQASAPIIGTDVVGSTPWGSPWGSPWSTGASIDTRWRIGGGTGQSVSFLLTLASKIPVIWLRTDARYEVGSAL